MEFALTMIAIADERLPTADEVQRAFASAQGEWGAISRLDRNDKAVTFELDGYNVAVGLVAKPIPWADLAGPVAASPLWPEAATKMQKQRAHLLVTVFAMRVDRLKMWMTMTRAAAGLCELPSVIGIYWPEAGLVHEPAAFRKLAAEMTRERLPLYLWISIRLGRNEDGSLFGFTTGLAAFEQMELEVSHCNWTPDELSHRLYNFAHYLLDRGPVLLDGQTIGLSADEQITIEHRPSLCGDDRTVIHLQP
ncbi:MAG TPA: DUF4261 domain-containing protein [Pirellulales bacterium]|jgi:hypothetical protein